MRNLLIFLAMMLCLFGPTALFAMVGYKSMVSLGKRPTDSARVMVALMMKIIAATAVIMGIQMALLKVFS